MRYGKISPAEHDRCIRNPLRRRKVLAAGKRMTEGPETDAGKNMPGISMRPVGGLLDLSPEMAVSEAVCRLYEGRTFYPDCGYDAAVKIQFLLTPETGEYKLQGWMDRIYEFCGQNGLRFAGADASVSNAAARDIISVQAFAGMHDRPEESSQGTDVLCPGTGLYMTGYAGMAGTGIICTALENELLGRFPAVMVEQGRQFSSMKLPALPCSVCWPVLDGGILGALWGLGEHFGIGMDIDLRAVPIRQETIEICEYLNLHPYQLYSCGAMLMAVLPGSNAEELWAEGEEAPCIQIGTVTEGKARTLHSGEDIRFLDKPAPDALAVLETAFCGKDRTGIEL